MTRLIYARRLIFFFAASHAAITLDYASYYMMRARADER